MSSSTQVVVAGLGIVGAAGAGRTAFETALREARPYPVEVDGAAGYHGPSSARKACLVGEVDVTRWIPVLEARRMSPPSRFAVIASRAALLDAGLAPPSEPDPSIAIALASCFGPSSYTQLLLDQIFREGPEAASPALFTECVVNAPAARVALHVRARGPNFTLSQGEAGPLQAVARGAAELLAGRARLALVGTSDEMTPLVHAILDRFRALARPDSEGEERARPFDLRRDGFLAGEGAAVLVLEPESSARRRRASVLARIRGAHAAFDPSAPTAGWGRGVEGLAAALVRGLERSGLRPGDIDAIVSGASGSRAGDRLEALVLRRAWGDRPLPPLLTPKATVGEYGGGFLAAAVLAAAGAAFGPTPGFQEPDPELGVRPHDGTPLEDVRHVLVTSLAAGGAAAWLVLERP